MLLLDGIKLLYVTAVDK